MPITTPTTNFDASTQGWIRVGYTDMRPTTKDGGNPAVLVPAVPIIVRNPSTGTLSDGSNIVLGKAIVDTGQPGRPSRCGRGALDIGIVKDGDVKRSAFGVSGRLDGYRAEIGINAWIGNQWLDVGVVTAPVPDAKRSRSPSAGQPFLPDRNGFRGRFNVCFDEPNQAIRRQSRRTARPRAT